MSDYGIKVSKEGASVKTGDAKDLTFTSQLDTFKILRTGSLSISLPEETFSSDNVVRTTSYTHNLGYIPFFLPMVSEQIYQDHWETGGDYIVNDLGEIRIPAGGYSPSMVAEISTVYSSTTALTLSINRLNALSFAATFGARKATLYYTIFSNRVNEQFNLLTD